MNKNEKKLIFTFEHIQTWKNLAVCHRANGLLPMASTSFLYF